MGLTLQQEERLQNIEVQLVEMRRQLDGAASKNMLNRLLTLANEENRKTTETLTELNTLVDELIALAQKLQ